MGKKGDRSPFFPMSVPRIIFYLILATISSEPIVKALVA